MGWLTMSLHLTLLVGAIAASEHPRGAALRPHPVLVTNLSDPSLVGPSHARSPSTTSPYVLTGVVVPCDSFPSDASGFVVVIVDVDAHQDVVCVNSAAKVPIASIHWLVQRLHTEINDTSTAPRVVRLVSQNGGTQNTYDLSDLPQEPERLSQHLRRLATACPDSSWLHYTDDGTEGFDSCFKVFLTPVSGLNVGRLCPRGSYLATFGSRFPNTGLMAAVVASVNASAASAVQALWIGCRQSRLATNPGNEWYWIDGTESSHLNCGSGFVGCNLWAPSEPNDYDSTGGLETHKQDQCKMYLTGSPGAIDDEAASSYFSFGYVCEANLTPSPTPTPTFRPTPSSTNNSLCPDAAWSYYSDTGLEGHDSCFKIFSTPVVWDVAYAWCPEGSHLATFRASGVNVGLVQAIQSINTANETLWIGCQQFSTAAHPGTGWYWIDGTSSSNINCGGCDLWDVGEPNDFGGGEKQEQDQCQLYTSGRIDDEHAHKFRGYVCEVDLVGPVVSARDTKPSNPSVLFGVVIGIIGGLALVVAVAAVICAFKKGRARNGVVTQPVSQQGTSESVPPLPSSTLASTPPAVCLNPDADRITAAQVEVECDGLVVEMPPHWQEPTYHATLETAGSFSATPTATSTTTAI